MAGKKATKAALERVLASNTEIRSIRVTRFTQGRTMRWAIAWSFYDIPDVSSTVSTMSASFSVGVMAPIELVVADIKSTTTLEEKEKDLSLFVALESAPSQLATQLRQIIFNRIESFSETWNAQLIGGTVRRSESDSRATTSGGAQKRSHGQVQPSVASAQKAAVMAVSARWSDDEAVIRVCFEIPSEDHHVNIDTDSDSYDGVDCYDDENKDDDDDDYLHRVGGRAPSLRPQQFEVSFTVQVSVQDPAKVYVAMTGQQGRFPSGKRYTRSYISTYNFELISLLTTWSHVIVGHCRAEIERVLDGIQNDIKRTNRR
jgi:RNA methyltransferase